MAEKTDETQINVLENDQDFLTAFYEYRPTLSDFHHVSQLRIIWLFLAEHGWDAGVMNVRYWFQRFLEHKSAGRQYHATRVEFWAKAVWLAIQDEQRTDFSAFLATHPSLVDEHLIWMFYSANTLWLDAARERLFPSDLMPLEQLEGTLKAKRPTEQKET